MHNALSSESNLRYNYVFPALFARRQPSGYIYPICSRKHDQQVLFGRHHFALTALMEPRLCKHGYFYWIRLINLPLLFKDTSTLENQPTTHFFLINLMPTLEEHFCCCSHLMLLNPGRKMNNILLMSSDVGKCLLGVDSPLASCFTRIRLKSCRLR